jgi:hypothetical protein
MDFTYFGLIDGKTSIDTPKAFNHGIILLIYLYYGLRGPLKIPDANNVVSFFGFFKWKWCRKRG